MNIQHYLTFAADQRLSMQIYAENCSNALRNIGIEAKQFQPSSTLERFAGNAMLMRSLRYWVYPYQVRNQQAELHHVLDHGYAHLAPKLATGKKIVTVHDLIPYLTWQGHIKTATAIKKPWLNLYSLNYVSQYDAVITPSQHTKEDLIKYFAIEAHKIHVIPPGLASCFKPANASAVNEFKEQYELPDDVFMVMISGREFYKNHSVCLQVLEELQAKLSRPVCLVKTGLPSPEFDQMVASMNLQNSIYRLFLNDVTELPLLYSSVDCLLFPSLYEGFGMPVLEALACGTPVVTSNVASLPEVAGEWAIQCDPSDVSQLTDATLLVLQNKDIKQRILEGAGHWVEPMRVDNIGAKLIQLYRQVLKQS